MKNLFGITLGLVIVLLCSAFANYSEINISQMKPLNTSNNGESSYYVNQLGDRVDVRHPSLHGCCYLVTETSGGRTCQKINF